MNNPTIIEMKLNATKTVVSVDKLALDPSMQMRVEMNHDYIFEYVETIEDILSACPLDVVVVKSATVETWYLVDGFHRYHAAIEAGLDQLPVKVMHGTFNEAVQYAMTANFKNGIRPNPKDTARCVPMLLKTAPDFGYDSKQVNKWVASFGVPLSTARDYTSPNIQAIKAKRDGKILELHEEGLKPAAIEDTTGIGYKTAERLIKEWTKSRADRMSNSESPNATPSIQGHSADLISTDEVGQEAELDDEELSFDLDELDTTPAINPADAFNQALKEHEEKREAKREQQEQQEQHEATSSNPEHSKTEPFFSSFNIKVKNNNENENNTYDEDKALLKAYAASLLSRRTSFEIIKMLSELSQGN